MLQRSTMEDVAIKFSMRIKPEAESNLLPLKGIRGFPMLPISKAATLPHHRSDLCISVLLLHKPLIMPQRHRFHDHFHHHFHHHLNCPLSPQAREGYSLALFLPTPGGMVFLRHQRG